MSTSPGSLRRYAAVPPSLAPQALEEGGETQGLDESHAAHHAASAAASFSAPLLAQHASVAAAWQQQEGGGRGEGGDNSVDSALQALQLTLNSEITRLSSDHKAKYDTAAELLSQSTNMLNAAQHRHAANDATLQALGNRASQIAAAVVAIISEGGGGRRSAGATGGAGGSSRPPPPQPMQVAHPHKRFASGAPAATAAVSAAAAAAAVAAATAAEELGTVGQGEPHEEGDGHNDGDVDEEELMEGEGGVEEGGDDAS